MSHFSQFPLKRVGGARALFALYADLVRRICGSAGVAKLLFSANALRDCEADTWFTAPPGWMTFAPEWLTGSPNLDTSNWMYL